MFSALYIKYVLLYTLYVILYHTVFAHKTLLLITKSNKYTLYLYIRHLYKNHKQRKSGWEIIAATCW